MFCDSPWMLNVLLNRCYKIKGRDRGRGVSLYTEQYLSHGLRIFFFISQHISLCPLRSLVFCAYQLSSNSSAVLVKTFAAFPAGVTSLISMLLPDSELYSDTVKENSK